MSLEELSVYMGHEDTDTTKGYIYNYNEIEKNREYMDKAFKYVIRDTKVSIKVR